MTIEELYPDVKFIIGVDKLTARIAVDTPMRFFYCSIPCLSFQSQTNPLDGHYERVVEKLFMSVFKKGGLNESGPI
jgi:hypothetical protein